MYVPATFAETAPDALTAIIRRHAFCFPFDFMLAAGTSATVK